jgi:ATP-dependent Clp protease ATP-binding subunit ClpX
LHFKVPVLIVLTMETRNDKIPNPEEIEKDISEFLAKKYGATVKMVSPMVIPHKAEDEVGQKTPPRPKSFNFELKPEDLIQYLDRYVIKQEDAKEILATKICTHFNRITRAETATDTVRDMVGGIKNNILMIGPTGVGKTYLVKLIAKRIGVPFVKGDATKFSETGYVGGDVEDLVRDLVREADDDIELAQYGIIYIDEIDKIAGSKNHFGADVSRTGVQRALLKPMEETEVDLKVPHDPISMFQEIERYRKTGNRAKRSVNTRNILFIMSGAFGGLAEIIRKRITSQPIGFGAQIKNAQTDAQILKMVKTEDLVEFGFESEFVGRLPVRAIFDPLETADLYNILLNPNNPIILSKRLDFAAYDIDVKFDEAVLKQIAKDASEENTGARGLVSAVEKALLRFERRLPSTDVKRLPITSDFIKEPDFAIKKLLEESNSPELRNRFQALTDAERLRITAYINENKKILSEKYGWALTPQRITVISDAYCRYVMEIGDVIQKVKFLYDEIKKAELHFYKNHDINIVLEEDAVEYSMEQMIRGVVKSTAFLEWLDREFEYGLKLIQEKTGKNRFFLTKTALINPGAYLDQVIRDHMRSVEKHELTAHENEANEHSTPNDLLP